MPIRSALWKVGPNPEPLPEASLPSERLLEDMIVAAPRLLSEDWMLIGRQEDTGYGGQIDLLAIAPDGGLVLIELKRDRTPREVVAQALDYASWVERLRGDDVKAIYRRFKPGRSLAEDFRDQYGQDLDESALNESHQIVIVAASLDDSTERIVGYLNDRDVPINVLCFQVFSTGSEQLLSRAWLLDPARTPMATGDGEAASSEPWNGEYYCSFGPPGHRSWDEAVKYGFISGGGGAFYSRTLHLLAPGDRIWVNVPGRGYVGVGRVTGRATRASEFKVKTDAGEAPALDVLASATYHREAAEDPVRSEYFVPVD